MRKGANDTTSTLLSYLRFLHVTPARDRGGACRLSAERFGALALSAPPPPPLPVSYQ